MQSDNFKTWEARILVFLVAFSIALQVFIANYHPAPTVISGQAVVNNPLEASTVKCLAGSLNCVEARNGSNIVGYSDNGTTQKFSLDAATGNIVSAGNIEVTGVITTDGGYIGITPVATATRISALPGLNITTPSALSVAGTPVFWATPQPVLGNETSGQYIKCTNSNVTGSLTSTPVSGATPVGNPFVSIGAVTGDAARASGAYSAGTFTISVSNSALTPATNTTPVAVEWCYIYTK